jgi:hypothetical protein
MSKLIATRGAQYVMETEFVFNFDNTMVSVAGAEVDFGKTNIVSTAFDVINLPAGAVILAGSLTVETAFDTASYSVAVGDSGNAARYLAAADRKALGVTALVPTGYRGDGENLRVTIINADVCTVGKATLRVQYITTGRANEVNPN